MIRRFVLIGLFAATAVLASPHTAASQDALVWARELYAAAAYEDALTMLDRVSAADADSDERRVVEQYRAFCLLALGRTAEADRAIEAVVAAAPFYRPADSDVSPRVRSAFSNVRRRMLPAVAQQRYAEAKAAFDRKQFEPAADLFAKVIELLEDADLEPVANQAPLSDLRTLAHGFRDLSVQSVVPPPAPLPPPPPEAAAPPPVVVAHRVYAQGEANVVPPTIVRQAMPAFPGRSMPRGQGVVEVLIDENGAVEAAVMRTPVTTKYDKLVLAAAQTWRYQPATVDGVPVKFRKEIAIAFK